MTAPKDEVIFSRKWLSLEKNDIELLAFLLLNNNQFVGNLSELCRSLGRCDNTRSTHGRQETIERLCAAGILSRTQLSKRRFEIHLSPPKEDEQIRMAQQHLEDIRYRRYDRDVAWQQVLKVYLWLKSKNDTIEFKRWQIAADLGVSTSTITAGIRVLEDHYGAIYTRKIGYLDSDGNPRCAGQEAELSAFWLNN